MRWKALFFLGLITTKQNTHETYGFKSDKNPDPVNEMKEFERRILGMIQNVEFIQLNGKHNNFQSNLSKDIKNMSGSQVHVKGDKSSNYFKLQPDKYEQLRERNIQGEYMKSSNIIEKYIIWKEKNIACGLNLEIE